MDIALLIICCFAIVLCNKYRWLGLTSQKGPQLHTIRMRVLTITFHLGAFDAVGPVKVLSIDKVASITYDQMVYSFTSRYVCSFLSHTSLVFFYIHYRSTRTAGLHANQ